MQGIEDKIYNYYSSHDLVLKIAYGAGKLAFRSPAIGREPIPVTEETVSRIENIDVTKFVARHTEYHEALGSILK
ncbi:MAG: DUF726 domain-containing protein [Proteobacteria bacterium]|nr:DUF726 domain-containing protein [Pseudomonadota bacterium]